MKNKTRLLITTALLCCMGAWAQTTTPAFDFRAVVQPFAVIGGHAFSPRTKLAGATLNDAGEIVFVATDSGNEAPTTIFTSRRIVAKQGDVVNGKYILVIPENGPVAINNAGQVAYVAYYADTREMAMSNDPSGIGIFVENRLVTATPYVYEQSLPLFTLTDDGRIIVLRPSAPPAPASFTPKPGVFGHIGVNLPKGFPKVPGLGPDSAKRQSPMSPSFPTNHRGQIVIPVNLDNDGGFYLLLGTPVAR